MLDNRFKIVCVICFYLFS